VDFLVSFNGKSFDRNVLADRFVMNRMSPSRVLELPHMDLLHPSRRLFGGLLGSCSLSALEEDFLAVYRHEAEVRGSEVPQRWFDYLRGGDVDLLEPVIEHNVLDVLSLVTLAGLLGACVEAPGLVLPQPRAQVALSRLFIERGNLHRAEELLRLLCRGRADDPVVYSALGLLAVCLRRTGRFEEAVSVWMRMIEAAGTSDIAPWLGAMIALEHRLRKPERALELAEEVLSRLEEGELLLAEVPALRHRRARLRRKALSPKSG
jgi:tetratricopeptide (TPR) repeat protein